ncbi:hypothetical protein [Massilia sp. TN1-12]|uniref:hypothetical protein n=1 Tax=Massilia paldalensis TaxID=3377675 RepID=UPI00384D1540
MPVSQPNYKLLGDAYAIIGGIPEKRFNLNFIARGTQDGGIACGTIGCAMGWLGLHPDFKPLLNMGNDGAPKWTVNGRRFSWYADAAAALFNIRESDAENLFSFRGGSKYDHAINRAGRVNDKERCLKRIRMFLDEKGIQSC